VSEAFVLDTDAAYVAGVHTREGGSPVAVLCASFDRVPTAGDTKITQPDDATITQQATSTAPVPTVSFSPDELGVPSALRDVTIPASISDARRAWVASFGSEPPFVVLNDYSVDDREILAQSALITTNVGTTTASTTPGEVKPSFVRMSNEYLGTSTLDDAARTRAVAQLTERAGLVSERDTDGDGISDYDEERLFGTNPDDPFTAGSIFSDGERVLLGLDPTVVSPNPVIVESPRVTGTEVPGLFAVNTIVYSVPAGEDLLGGEDSMSDASTSDVYISTSTQIVISGTTKPLSFVTLFIYSDPIIVTVRADEQGAFYYMSDEPFADGQHTLYVAAVNGRGQIIAKSAPVSFVKTAQAITILTNATSSTPNTPVDSSRERMVTFALLTLLLLGVAMIVLLGRHPHEYEGDTHTTA